MGVEYGADVDKYYCSADSGEGIARGTLAAQPSRSARKKSAAADEEERPTRVAVPKMAVFEVGGASRHAITIRPTPHACAVAVVVIIIVIALVTVRGDITAPPLARACARPRRVSCVTSSQTVTPRPHLCRRSRRRRRRRVFVVIVILRRAKMRRRCA